MENHIFLHTPSGEKLIDEIRKSLPDYVHGKRLIHTHAVEEEALYIAEIVFKFLGTDSSYLRDVSAAALLHDLTKQKSNGEQIEMCEKYGIETGEYGENGSAVLHAKTSAYAAREIFGINDSVFCAIYSHTTGKENMNVLEKIIFIADYTEKTRTANACVSVRNMLHGGLDRCENPIKVLDTAIISALKSTIDYLLQTDSVIDCQTVKALNFLLAEYALLS